MEKLFTNMSKSSGIKAKTQLPYRAFGKFVFRAPLFPVSVLHDLYTSDFFDEDRALLDNPYFKEAILLSSGDLYEELEKLNTDGKKGNLEINVKISILKYLIRMCTRCTPFGLFAGCGVGTIAGDSRIELTDTFHYKSHTRLDMNYLCSLVHEISKSKVGRQNFKFFSNNSIYYVGGNLRYTEYTYSGKSNRRRHFLSSAELTPYLSVVLETARNGATLHELEISLSKFEVSGEEAYEYLSELVDNQILTSEIEPAVTGNDLLETLIYKLNQIDKGNRELLTLQKQLSDLNNLPIGRPKNEYHSIIDGLKNLRNDYNSKYLFQTDLLLKSDQATLSQSVVDNVLAGIRVLNKLTPMPADTILDRFKKDFFDRYEYQEIPLLEALDSEIGVAFGNANLKGDLNPLIDDIRFPTKRNQERTIKVDLIQQLLLTKYDDFLKNTGENEIVLMDEELTILPESWHNLPDTMYAMFSILKNDTDSLIDLRACSGPSAANLLGRFCYMDTEIHDLAKSIVEKEEELNSDSILAEVVHLPESRTGNILFRPTIRKYEITYLANPSTESPYVIPASDLTISVVNGKVILKSIRLKKRVIPRLTNAHNYSANSTPVYHFLCSMQTQHLRVHLDFTWGQLLAGKLSLPRVRYNNIILSPAIWNISARDIQALPAIEEKKFAEAVQKFRSARNIPDKVLVSTGGDNKLLINFNHLPSVQLLFSERKMPIVLEEFLFNETAPLIQRGEQAFTNELILCFHRNNAE